MNLKLTNDEIDCQHCGHIWEPTSESETLSCPLCRRSLATQASPRTVKGDIPVWRVKAAEERIKKAAAEAAGTKKVAKK